MKLKFLISKLLITLLLVSLIQKKFTYSQIFFETSTQNTDENKKRLFSFQKIFFGGNFGLQFGNFTLIELSPLIGYKISDYLSLGTQLIFTYTKIKNYGIKTYIYGNSYFLRYYFHKNFFSHIEYQWLKLDSKYTSIFLNAQKSYTLNNLYLGAGIKQIISPRSFISLIFLYNVNHSSYSPYENPIIKINFEFF